MDSDHVAAADLVAGFAGLAIDGDRVGVNGLSHQRAADVAHLLGKELIEAQHIALDAGNELKRFGHDMILTNRSHFGLSLFGGSAFGFSVAGFAGSALGVSVLGFGSSVLGGGGGSGVMGLVLAGGSGILGGGGRSMGLIGVMGGSSGADGSGVLGKSNFTKRLFKSS